MNAMEDCKLNNRMTNPDYTKSIQGVISDRQYPSEIPISPRNQFP